MVNIKGRFDIDDIAQQTVGGLVIGGPFVVTEETWSIASKMSIYNVFFTFLIVLVLGYGILYVAVLRDPDVEASFGVVPLRFVSLIIVAYLSGIIVAVSTGASSLFTDTSGGLELVWVVFKASTTISIFTVIGAGTADSIFGEPKKKEAGI
jgi:uncharacterized membrane protein